MTKAFRTIHDDRAFINPDTISSYANTNEAFLTQPVRGMVIELPGLGGGSCLGGQMNRADYDTPYARSFAEKGIVLAYMFPGPWSWGNRAAVRMTDAVISALTEKHGLGTRLPLAVCGGSMGGLGALIFAADTTHRLCGVAAACPCIDVAGRFDAHPDFPRTFVSAVAGYDLPLDEALRTISPAAQLDRMPSIPYFICSDGQDEVFPEAQCDEYVRALCSRGHDVTYHRQSGLKHGEFFPEVRKALHNFLMDRILESAR